MARAVLAPDETVILLHPPLPLAGVSIVMERGCRQNDRTLVRGQGCTVVPFIMP